MGKSASGHRKAGFARESFSPGLVRQRRAVATALSARLWDAGKTRLILAECPIEMDLMETAGIGEIQLAHQSSNTKLSLSSTCPLSRNVDP